MKNGQYKIEPAPKYQIKINQNIEYDTNITIPTSVFDAIVTLLG